MKQHLAILLFALLLFALLVGCKTTQPEVGQRDISYWTSYSLTTFALNQYFVYQDIDSAKGQKFVSWLRNNVQEPLMLARNGAVTGQNSLNLIKPHVPNEKGYTEFYNAIQGIVGRSGNAVNGLSDAVDQWLGGLE